MLMVVVLPAPLGPRNPKTSPCSTENETPLTASMRPNRRASSSTSITGIAPPAYPYVIESKSPGAPTPAHRRILPPMRIASLVPSATEMLFALGLGDRVVAVTHECDYPAAAAALPHVTRSVIPGGLTAADIDQAVRSRVARGEALYELDVSRLTEAAPDL